MRFTAVAFISLALAAGSNQANTTRSPKRDKRLAIQGDGDANFDEFRFTVSIEDWSGLLKGRICGAGHHRCGGSIITPKFVLTAGHCVERKWYQLPRKLKVRAGSPKKGDGGNLHEVARLIDHERYQKTSEGFDIALLKLKTNIDVDHSHAQVIPMVSSGFILNPDAEVKVAGWGRRADDTFPEHLQSLELHVIDRDICNYRDYRALKVVAGEFCARSGRGSILDGDSGGPAVVRVGDKYKLAGIIVRSHDKKPDIFTDVAHYRQWIDDTIRCHDSGNTVPM